MLFKARIAVLMMTLAVIGSATALVHGAPADASTPGILRRNRLSRTADPRGSIRFRAIDKVSGLAFRCDGGIQQLELETRRCVCSLDRSSGVGKIRRHAAIRCRCPLVGPVGAADLTSSTIRLSLSHELHLQRHRRSAGASALVRGSRVSDRLLLRRMAHHKAPGQIVAGKVAAYQPPAATSGSGAGTKGVRQKPVPRPRDQVADAKYRMP